MPRLPIAAALLLTTAAAPLTAQEPNFGRAMAATASELYVGQPVNWYGPGTVYAYRLGSDGRWQERGRLFASDSSRKDDFGRAIAVDGNTMVVGAPRKGTGAAYVFTRRAADARWQEAARLVAPDSGDFGYAVAIDGPDLLIGAPGVAPGGVVYRYRREGTAWRLRAVVRASGGDPDRSPDPGAGFGAAISQQGDWLLIGAPGVDSSSGAIYFAQRQDDGAWGTPAEIRPPRARLGPQARLGAAVLLEGDHAWVGAPGAATAFALSLGPDGRWTPSGTLQPFESPRGSQFGTAIATVGGEVWVGAPMTNRGNGRVYRFTPDGSGGWSSATRFDADSADGTSWPFAYGYSLVAAGDQMVIGQPYRDFGEGRVLVAARREGAWQQQQLLEGEVYALGGSATPAARCQDGKIGAFTCNNVELIAHMPTSALGGGRGVWVNDVWGWTDPATQRDYALVARRDGAAFVDVTDPSQPRLVGSLPRTAGSPPSVWRDIKVIDNHAYIVADGSGAHGVQVFDLTRLRDARGAPRDFTPDTTYHEIYSAHNIVADTASKFLYVVGANSGGESCGGGLHMVDARDPEQLRFAGCYNDRAGANPRGYTHDAQCLVYRGPDTRYTGHQICVGSNEKEINIADVTDKANPVVIGRNSYPNVAYAHQGWFDDAQRYFYMDDEEDEAAGLADHTRTIVWDLSELDDPVVATIYHGPVASSDHNLYVVGNRVYESNYGSGLRVLDISDRTAPREIGFFDSAPLNHDEPGFSATASGAWSNYPFFKNGLVVFTSVREGLFLVKVQEALP